MNKLIEFNKSKEKTMILTAYSLLNEYIFKQKYCLFYTFEKKTHITMGFYSFLSSSKLMIDLDILH